MPGIVTRMYYSEHETINIVDDLHNTFPQNNWKLLIGKTHRQVVCASNNDSLKIQEHYCSNEDSELVLYGHCIDNKLRCSLSAPTLIDGLQKEGKDFLQRLEGAFIIIWHRHKLGKAIVINDRLGILPYYWQVSPTGFDLAFRMRYLPGHQTPGAIDPKGLITFLGIGYCLGETTLQANVKLLTPASYLEINLKEKTLDHSHYWDLQYTDESRQPLKHRCRELHNAIVDSVDLLAPAGDDNGGLFLSGGWDCRAILGAQLQLERPPSLVVTNGKNDTTKGTDTAFARQLAEDIKLNYRFCKRKPNLSSVFCSEGIQQCELITDTAPEIFGQHRLPEDPFREIDFIFKGDEVWGWQDPAENRLQAIGNVVPTHLPHALGRCLKEGLSTSAEETYQQQIDQILNQSPNENWNDRKDYLYLKGRVTRYIFGVGSSDEEHIQVRRPLLTGQILEHVSRTPRNQRIQKNLFLRMLREHQSSLYSYRRNHVSHIANYYYHMALFIRKQSLAHLESGHDLGGLICVDACKKLFSEFHPDNYQEDNPPLKERARDYLLDRWGFSWYGSSLYRRRSMSGFLPWCSSDQVFTFRLFLLLEYFHGHEFPQDRDHLT